MSAEDFEVIHDGHKQKKLSELETVISAGIEAAQKITDTWQNTRTGTLLEVPRNLANAINELEDWATQAADWLPDEE